MRVLAALALLGLVALLLAAMMPSRPNLRSPMAIDPLRISERLI
jgi:hypothetical protein